MTIDQIALYPEKTIHEINTLKAKFQEEMGQSGTGIGFIGSLEWVAAGAAAMGIIESMISSSKTKNGIELLKIASSLSLNLTKQQEFFSIQDIFFIDRPNPSVWSAQKTIKTFEVNLSTLGMMERMDAINKYALTPEQVNSGLALVSETEKYIHNSDDFILVKSQQKSIFIQWKSVELFEAIE